MKNKRHYSDKDGFAVTSRGAVFSFVNTNRNFGKTWLFKKRAFKRALKHGRKTIWVRRFKKEAKEAAAKFFTSADLRKYCKKEGVLGFDETRFAVCGAADDCGNCCLWFDEKDKCV